MSWLDKFRKPEPNVIEEYSVKLFKKAMEGTEAIKHLSEDRSEQSERYGLTEVERFAVFNEFQYFFLHLTDRMAFGNMDEKRRGKVMSELERWSIDLAVETICDGWPADRVEKIKRESMQNFLNSTGQYSQCKDLFAKKGEGMKDTLFWEFGKQVTELAGRGLDIVFTTCAMQFAINASKELGLKEFVEKVK